MASVQDTIDFLFEHSCSIVIQPIIPKVLSQERNPIYKSLMKVQSLIRRIRREWNVDPPSRKSIYEWDRTLRDRGSLISKTGKHPKIRQERLQNAEVFVNFVDAKLAEAVKTRGEPD
ncbi:hypothetical protein C0J52_23073 [Blattella germanica]|nr:hypothetical protein C0J52_23073 [Blattella germanica]